MIILGIDTAIRCTGYGVVSMPDFKNIGILDCGVIKNTQKMPHSECLRRIGGGIRELIKRFSPETAAIEGAFVDRNIKTAMILSLARGAAIYTCAEAGVSVFEYSPKVAKRAITGTGNASKEQIAAMIAGMLNIEVKDIPRDSTDALALAICHGQIALKPELNFLLPKPK